MAERARVQPNLLHKVALSLLLPSPQAAGLGAGHDYFDRHILQIVRLLTYGNKALAAPLFQSDTPLSQFGMFYCQALIFPVWSKTGKNNTLILPG